jgi:polar amino acid transport system substrate-binding protein
MLKTFKIAAIAVAMGIAGAGAALAETVKIGFSADPYVPFTSLDASGKFVGWEVEFKDAICKQANLDCQIVLVSWDGIIPALTSKKIDLIIGSMSITDERKKVIDFTDKYYDTPAVVIANNMPWRISSRPKSRNIRPRMKCTRISPPAVSTR